MIIIQSVCPDTPIQYTAKAINLNQHICIPYLSSPRMFMNVAKPVMSNIAFSSCSLPDLTQHHLG